jgi:hypothetical protein
LPKTKTAELCYVYCAVEGAPQSLPLSGMPGGGPPRTLPLHDTVTLIVSDVSAATYNSDALEPRLSDLDWVSAAGAAHHGVVDALAEMGLVVLPFRLFTLFSSPDKAVATLTDSRDRITRAFDRVRGKQEWVLRIGKPDPARITAPAKDPPPPASGTNFLQAKADARREAAARATRVKEDTAAAYEALEQLADAAKARPVDSAGTLMLDAAFLLPPSRVEAIKETLTRRADRLLRDGCPVSLTGPWPPYSFASLEGNG